jgi:signal transduction histidine kinase
MQGYRSRVTVRYGLAVLSVTAALVVARLLGIYLVSAPVSLFLCAIMVSGWFGGGGPATLAVVLSHLGFVHDFITPTYSFGVAMPEVPRLIIFSLSAVFVASLSAMQRRASETLRRANDALQAENAERKRAEQALEVLAGRLIHAQEEERKRVGRELHDHISQTLGVLTIKIDQLRTHEQLIPEIGDALDDLRRDTTVITDDVHRLSHRLHSSTLDYLGLVPALQKLASEFSARHGISIAFSHASLPPSLPPEVALCLFRVAEESLTNVARHSRAPSASIRVTSTPHGLELKIEDAGIGFDLTTLASRGGLGFVSMQERLRVLHGTVRVDSAPSRGTRIIAWVPSMFTEALVEERRA